MTKEELTEVKGGISFGLFNVVVGLGRFIISIAKKTLYPVKFRI